MPFPNPRKHHQDLAASQALQPVPGTLAASQALSGTVAGSTRSPRQTQQAAVEEEQGDVSEELDEQVSPGARDHVISTCLLVYATLTCMLIEAIRLP